MRTSEQKREALLQLAKKRQADRRDGYLCLSDIHDGYYECDYVSPWSISAHDVDADLMIFGKDWASSETLVDHPPDPDRQKIGQCWKVPTNKNLREYLCDCMGGLTFSQTYASNVFPFIKFGKKNGSIPRADMLYAAETYALPQIKIVQPRMVICLGRPAFYAVRRSADLEVETYGVSHPSVFPSGKIAVKKIWRQLGDRLDELRKGLSTCQYPINIGIDLT